MLIAAFLMLIGSACNKSGVVDPEEMPEVITTQPPGQSQNVPVNTDITATFSKKINPSTLSSTTFMLSQNDTAVLGVVSTTDTTATLSPLGNLSPNTRYTATLTTDVEDRSGNALAQNYSWSFMTGGSQEETPGDDENTADNTPPVIETTEPNDHDVDIPKDVSVSVTFSESLSPATVTNNTFTLRDGTQNIEGSVEYEQDDTPVATFDPSDELPPGRTLTATVAAQIEDTAGNTMEETYQWSFTTAEEEEDDTPPEIVALQPESDEDDVGTDITIEAEFDEEMDPSTINGTTFTLEWSIFGLRQEVSGTVEYEDNTATFTPDEPLNEDRVYTANISEEITDASGHPLEESINWSFRTEEENGGGDEDEDEDE